MISDYDVDIKPFSPVKERLLPGVSIGNGVIDYVSGPQTWLHGENVKPFPARRCCTAYGYLYFSMVLGDMLLQGLMGTIHVVFCVKISLEVLCQDEFLSTFALVHDAFHPIRV